jgi:hypothetical protein
LSKRQPKPEENPLEVLNRPENVLRVEKFKAMAQAQEEQVAQAAAATAKLFDPVALIKRASEIHAVQHPTLGLIKFGELKLSDSETVNKCKGQEDRSAMAVYLMLKKAYPEMPQYTPETIGDFYRVFPLVEGGALLAFFTVQPCFLGEKSKSGLEQTQAQTN